MSDHFPVFYIEETKQNNVQLPDKVVRNINQNTIPAFCNILKSTKWTNVINDKNPQTAFDNFFNVINSARDIAFPEKKVKQKAKRFVHSPWITKGLIISHRRKEKLFAKKKRNPSDINQQNFKQYNMIYNKLRRPAT